MKLLCFFISLFLIGCSSTPGSYKEIRGSFKDNKKHLELRDSFAFYHDGHEYYFAQKKDKVGKTDCFTIIGFKDNKVAYTFPSTHFWELESIYSKNATPEERINLTVKSLEKFQMNQSNQHCVSRGLTTDDIGYIVVFSPILIFVAPMAYMKDLSNDVDDLLVDFDDVKLGMSFKEVKKLARNRPFRVREDNGVKVYVLDKANQRLVMYFKKDRLHAWVRGYRPQGDNFPVYQRSN